MIYLKIPKTTLLGLLVLVISFNFIFTLKTMVVLESFGFITLLVGLWHIGERPLSRYPFIESLFFSNSNTDGIIFIDETLTRMFIRVLSLLGALYLSRVSLFYTLMTFMYIREDDYFEDMQ